MSEEREDDAFGDGAGLAEAGPDEDGQENEHHDQADRQDESRGR